MYLKINRKMAFLSSTVGQKSQNIVVTHLSIPYFCRHSLKILSKLMNWILLSPPPLSSDPNMPPKFETCTSGQRSSMFGTAKWRLSSGVFFCMSLAEIIKTSLIRCSSNKGHKQTRPRIHNKRIPECTKTVCPNLIIFPWFFRTH